MALVLCSHTWPFIQTNSNGQIYGAPSAPTLARRPQYEVDNKLPIFSSGISLSVRRTWGGLLIEFDRSDVIPAFRLALLLEQLDILRHTMHIGIDFQRALEIIHRTRGLVQLRINHAVTGQ